MIIDLFKIVLAAVISTINVILTPIYTMISLLLGFHFDDLIDSINSLINSFINFVPFIRDMFFISPSVMSLIVDYLIFKYTAKFSLWFIKLAIKWYNALKT